MKLISYEQYLALHNDAEILASDSFGEKVLRLKDGSIIKLFRTKRIISSALFYPYALRFVHNSSKLKNLGINTVTVINAFKIPSIKRTAVHYKELEGDTLRNHIMHHSLNGNIVQKLAAFIAKLHNEGVYFRSIHFGNILIISDKGFGLIDIADMKTKGRPLSLRERTRNFFHLTRYEIDKKSLMPEKNAFTESYINESGLAPNHSARLKKTIDSILS